MEDLRTGLISRIPSFEERQNLFARGFVCLAVGRLG